MKYYVNMQTGEIVAKKNYLSALWYFIADGIKCGYKVSVKDIKKN